MRWEAWVIVCWYVVNVLASVALIGRRKSNQYYTAGETFVAFVIFGLMAILVIRLGTLR